MSEQTSERPPVWVRGDVQKINEATRSDTQSTEILAELHRRADLEGYVVRAVTTMTNGHVKAQHFNSLHAAVRAQERAEARGCECVLSLCRVVPVSVDLDEGGQHE